MIGAGTGLGAIISAVDSVVVLPGEQLTKRVPGCLGYIGDYTAQLYGDCKKPLQGSLLNNHYNGT